jgi:pyruvate carboxylase
MYAASSRILGRPTKVTPSSKVVGDLALHLVAVGADPDEFAANPQNYDIPDSVVGFLSGELGDPPGGWPEPFRSRRCRGVRSSSTTRSCRSATPPILTSRVRSARPRSTGCCSPGRPRSSWPTGRPTATWGRLDTLDFLYGLQPGEEHVARIGKGVSLILGLSAISPPDERGMRTVMCTINGQLRPIRVRDTSIKVDVKVA